METRKIIMCRGIQGSGKSTWARNIPVEECIRRDSLRPNPIGKRLFITPQQI